MKKVPQVVQVILILILFLLHLPLPPSFEKKFGEDKVNKLNKSLYGLKQSPRAWFECFGKVVKNHSDDIAELERLKKGLAKNFKIEGLGALKYFLGMEFNRSKEGGSRCGEQKDGGNGRCDEGSKANERGRNLAPCAKETKRYVLYKRGELGVQGEVHKEVKSNRGGPKFVVMFGNEVEATHKGDSERWSVLGIDMINSMRFRGSRIFILTAKLKAFKMDLKSWNQEVFGSVLVKKLEAFNKIDSTKGNLMEAEVERC
ncbi:hypothetical protein CK203_099116 [Vitis vinifera]|uniref:Reverse transcriptase Ty1/copia-type domain-containing protein n=1 Tax=Vitis vinifera TaxID=29760 RepID=A0A438CWL9_VITVI|nr:hypothetical protein CK203_099116 [Vitis vinifera]